MNHHLTLRIPVTELKTALLGLGKAIHRSSTLPVLTTVCVERDQQGTTYLGVTDLDTFVRFRLEGQSQPNCPTRLLVPFADLHKLGKTCPLTESLELTAVGEEQVLTRYHLNHHPVEQTLATSLVADFPLAPPMTAASISLDEAAKTTLLNALACGSDDETRLILNGAYLDVSKPSGHYAVATDGRHLFASNSLHLPLPASVLVPNHRFLTWGGFVRDGQWKLSVQTPTKDKGGFIQVESSRWSFLTKQVEGTYPNWRTITEDVQTCSGSIRLSEQAAQAMQTIVPRLPGDEEPNHTVGLQVQNHRLLLRGWNKGQEKPTDVEVPDITIRGNPAPIYLNRQYLLKALGFGLRQIDVQETLKPLRVSDGGSKQMIIMPVRVDGYTNAPVSLRNPPASTSTDVEPIITTNPPPSAERNNPPMQNNSNNQGSNPPVATAESTTDKVSVDQALDQVEFIKTSLRGAITNLNGLADTLRQIQRERRISEREVRSVRDTLKSLQTVRL